MWYMLQTAVTNMKIDEDSLETQYCRQKGLMWENFDSIQTGI